MHYRNGNPDLALVDGRFRVACALQIMYESPTTRILMHDFTIRPFYNVVLRFASVRETARTSVVLQMKSDVDKEELLKVLEHHRNITAR